MDPKQLALMAKARIKRMRDAKKKKLKAIAEKKKLHELALLTKARKKKLNDSKRRYIVAIEEKERNGITLSASENNTIIKHRCHKESERLRLIAYRQKKKLYKTQ
jgi:hypothetical protein